ncbi:MAG: glycosyltransferase family 2 protein [Candidatus Hydrogenedentota bacterium]|nr:glycosyltransferase family 2 protein [Candidatus Sumerlaea chitinivorans]RMH27243.1 MAG: glycosyltransferase family 2 protein [Candidatus Hydrogenedentota bacterium]GIX45284.1 MAG: glycosyl transferase [Candidatus Sumerlaea sp.]
MSDEAPKTTVPQYPSSGAEGKVPEDADLPRARSRPYLSLIIPAYNEQERLSAALPPVLRYLANQPYTWEIVVVDDGSRDATSEVARQIAAHYPVRVLRNEPNRGKGYSIRRGMLEARGEFRLFSDADFSTPIEEIEKFWSAVREGYDVVIGSRALRESQLLVRQNWMRETMGRTFNLIVQALLLPGIHDTQCGFKMFSARAAEAVFPEQSLDGFSFDVEILALALRKGFRVKEVPIRWINSPATKVSPIRDAVKMFRDVLRVRWRLR